MRETPKIFSILFYLLLTILVVGFYLSSPSKDDVLRTKFSCSKESKLVKDVYHEIIGQDTTVHEFPHTKIETANGTSIIYNNCTNKILLDTDNEIYLHSSTEEKYLEVYKQRIK